MDKLDRRERRKMAKDEWRKTKRKHKMAFQDFWRKLIKE